MRVQRSRAAGSRKGAAVRGQPGAFVPLFADDLAACRGAPELVGVLAALVRATTARAAGVVDPWASASSYVLKATGFSDRTLRRHLEELERRGFVLLRGEDGRLLGVTSASLDRFYRGNFGDAAPGRSKMTALPRTPGAVHREGAAIGDRPGRSEMTAPDLIQTARVGSQSEREVDPRTSEAGAVTNDRPPPEAEGETGRPADADPTADPEPTADKLAERRARLEALGLVRRGAFRGRAGGAATPA